MHTIDRSEVERYVLNLAQEFSAKKDASLEQYVYRNLHIDREDAVEFYSDIEKEFNVDLRPITEKTSEIGPTWFRKSRRKTMARDPTLKEIVAFVFAAKLKY